MRYLRLEKETIQKTRYSSPSLLRNAFIPQSWGLLCGRCDVTVLFVSLLLLPDTRRSMFCWLKGMVQMLSSLQANTYTRSAHFDDEESRKRKLHRLWKTSSARQKNPPSKKCSGDTHEMQFERWENTCVLQTLMSTKTEWDEYQHLGCTCLLPSLIQHRFQILLSFSMHLFFFLLMNSLCCKILVCKSPIARPQKDFRETEESLSNWNVFFSFSSFLANVSPFSLYDNQERHIRLIQFVVRFAFIRLILSLSLSVWIWLFLEVGFSFRSLLQRKWDFLPDLTIDFLWRKPSEVSETTTAE